MTLVDASPLDVRDEATGVTLRSAERSIIGWVLDAANAATAEKVISGLLSAHFFDPAHETIFAVAAKNLGSPDVLQKCLADLVAPAAYRRVQQLPGGLAEYLSNSVHQAAYLGAEQVAGYYRQVMTAFSTRRIAELNGHIATALEAGDLTTVRLLSDDLREKVDAAVNGRPDSGKRRLRLTPASSFRIRGVKWVWDNRMPVGALTLIPGREGVGKSTFLAWMTSAITRGELPGMHYGTPKSVLYSASEDAWEYTIAPRMLAAGADMDRVFRIDAALEGDGYGGVVLPRDCRELVHAARDVDAALLACDPIISLVDERLNTFKAKELRTALEPLVSAAEEAEIGIGALVHFNKGQGSDVGTLISGARAWVEVARAVVAIGRDKEVDEYTCVVSQTKNNLGVGDLPNLTYTIDSHELLTSDGETANVGRLRWTGETDRGVEDLLAEAASGAVGSTGKSGKLMRELIDYVTGKCPTPMQAVSTADLIAEFEDEYKPDLIRQTLSRAVRKDLLWSPMRGAYRPLVHRPAGVTNA
ncbi:hypothetical protein Ato02nite_005150 [Paractinoplanes toevensis]|uniref:DNA helicase DnaB-like N-terminal domain-containing protein n=1 Tax=Paractinoplanes toevensis TaxID=571911 RepID=A0A919T5G5_9ACTN|nr:hypothetical protein Ato02nite_005150 [Actinoplanes toevensis]